MPACAQAVVRIGEDHGGRIGNYLLKYKLLSLSGEPVIIDGLCASACTMVLMLPKHQICATPRAVLGFHQAYDFGTASIGGRMVSAAIPNREATDLLFSYYPKPVHAWINMHNGMPQPSRILALKWPEIAKFVPQCPRQGALPALY